MENLETVLPGGVQVSTLEPVRAKDGHITVRLRVIGPRDRAVDLVRNLEHSRRFLLPRIVGENSETSNAPNQRMIPVSATNPFNFELLAEYNPPTTEEARSLGKKTGAAPILRYAPEPGESSFRPHEGRIPYTGENAASGGQR
jgi:type IV pilus assembly protein PilN